MPKRYFHRFIKLIMKDEIEGQTFLLQLLIMKDEIEALKMNPQSLLMDNLHLVGYAGDYSKSFSASESSLSTLNGRILRDFVNVSHQSS